jgi:hypothetical protein
MPPTGSLCLGRSKTDVLRSSDAVAPQIALMIQILSIIIHSSHGQRLMNPDKSQNASNRKKN